MSNYCIGIDYSLTGPAACKHPANMPWDVKNCQFFYMTSIKKHIYKYSTSSIVIEGVGFPEYDNDMVRFIQNAKVVKDWCAPDEGDHVAIEGYAFGARGSRIFQIGEATGILVLFMMFNSSGTGFINSKRLPKRPAPSEVKKFATGSGAANKDRMYEYWYKDTGIDLMKLFDVKNVKSPINDLVDAYWVCKLIHNQEFKYDSKKENNQK